MRCRSHPWKKESVNDASSLPLVQKDQQNVALNKRTVTVPLENVNDLIKNYNCTSNGSHYSISQQINLMEFNIEDSFNAAKEVWQDHSRIAISDHSMHDDYQSSRHILPGEFPGYFDVDQ